MSSEVAVAVRQLSKCYHIYDKPSDRLKQSLYPRICSALGRPVRSYFREFWALKGVSFEISRGETVGVVGRNGSGKSTLLQLICGTLNPTAGTIKASGRIAALLELGSGFNPEFTGRENVYMNAALLGLSKQEIDSRYDDIIRFADIGDFVDQPVKTYSSGMVVRLAFAVAINSDPEILVVDEALSVGDELFQRKCFSRIAAIKQMGATILFVSHSGGTVVELCDRAILMDAGELLAQGSPKQIVAQYQTLLYAPTDRRDFIRTQIQAGTLQPDRSKKSQNIVTSVSAAETALQLTADPSGGQDFGIAEDGAFDSGLVPTSVIRYESHGAYIDSARILTENGRQVNVLVRGRRYRYCYIVRFEDACSSVRFGMLIKTVSGVELGGAASAPSIQHSIPAISAGTTYSVQFTFTCSLNPGVFFLNAGVVGVVDGSETYLHRIIDIAMFRVENAPGILSTGIVDFSCTPHTEVVQGY